MTIRNIEFQSWQYTIFDSLYLCDFFLQEYFAWDLCIWNTCKSHCKRYLGRVVFLPRGSLELAWFQCNFVRVSSISSCKHFNDFSYHVFFRQLSLGGQYKWKEWVVCWLAEKWNLLASFIVSGFYFCCWVQDDLKVSGKYLADLRLNI